MQLLRRRLTIIALLLFIRPALGDEPPPPDPKHPVDYVKWLADRYGKGESAYDAAVAAFKTDEAAETLAKRGPSAPWTDDDRRALAGWVESNAECLRLFTEASKAARWTIPYASASGAVMDVELKALAPIRNCARVITTRARLRFTSGDTAGGLADLEATFRCARHLASQPFLIARLVAVAVNAAAHDTVLAVLRERGTDAELCRALLDCLTKSDRPLPSMDAVIAGERIMLLDGAQRYLQDTNGDGAYDRVADPTGQPGGGARGVPQDPPRRLDEILREIDAHFERVRKLPAEPQASFRKLAAEIESRRKESGNTLLTILAADVSRAVELDRRGVAISRAVRLILRLHLEHAKQGRWPAALRAAAGAEFAACCVDPFSGKDFVYRVENGQPLLYSASENGVDDGGQRPAGKTWAADGDAVLWPPEAPP